MKPLLHLLLISGLAATSNAQLKPTLLTGTWRVTEIKTTFPEARTITNPQPSLLIFTGNHYSLMIIESDKPRAEIQDLQKASAAELLATWGPFTAASGSYDISGDTLTMRPAVAKNQVVMAPDNVQLNTFKLEGKTLTVTRTRNGKNPARNALTITCTRIE